MAVKTITITVDAYNALNNLKETRESFSQAILRISRRKPLRMFYGAVSKRNGERLEKAVTDLRKKRKEQHLQRMSKIARAFQEAY